MRNDSSDDHHVEREVAPKHVRILHASAVETCTELTVYQDGEIESPKVTSALHFALGQLTKLWLKHDVEPKLL